MTAPRDRKWMSIDGLAGGLAMFAVEALIVIGLATAAVIVAVVVLAIL
jgi:hypothetical protein